MKTRTWSLWNLLLASLALVVFSLLVRYESLPLLAWVGCVIWWFAGIAGVLNRSRAD